jgi:hypothetical protein
VRHIAPNIRNTYSELPFSSSDIKRLNVVALTSSLAAASLRLMWPAKKSRRVFFQLDGLGFLGRPNLTPCAFALAMPSAWCCFMDSRSTWAT